MKGPFSIWAFFGLTLWIDVLTHAIYTEKNVRVNPYNPVKSVTVIIPIHKEEKYIEKTIKSIYEEGYPVKNIIVCGDYYSEKTKDVVVSLMEKYKNLCYLESVHVSKARKINYTVKRLGEIIGDFVYVRDARVVGEKNSIGKMISYFNDEKVAAVTSYGRLSKPNNILSKAYFYGKSWINEIGRFRKNAQEKRSAVFVICGASTIYRKSILEKFHIPYRSKTEDTYYTWKLQSKGYKIRVADDVTVSAPDVDGEKTEGIKGQLKQAYRWSCGTIQCLYLEGRGLLKNKKLAYTTVIPGLLESVMYSIPLVLLPLLFFISPVFALAFLIGDTVFSLLGTLIIIPKKFVKTVVHYPQIMFFKYANSLVFLSALFTITGQAITGKTGKWTNSWLPPKTEYSV